MLDDEQAHVRRQGCVLHPFSLPTPLIVEKDNVIQPIENCAAEDPDDDPHWRLYKQGGNINGGMSPGGVDGGGGGNAGEGRGLRPVPPPPIPRKSRSRRRRGELLSTSRQRRPRVSPPREHLVLCEQRPYILLYPSLSNLGHCWCALLAQNDVAPLGLCVHGD